MSGNIKFWKLVTRLLSDKILSDEKISLIHVDELIDTDIETCKFQNLSFSNATIYLKLDKYAYCEPISETITNPLLESIVDFHNHCTSSEYYGTLKFLNPLPENWKLTINKNQSYGALLTDLFTDPDCLFISNGQ